MRGMDMNWNTVLNGTNKAGIMVCNLYTHNYINYK